VVGGVDQKYKIPPFDKGRNEITMFLIFNTVTHPGTSCPPLSRGDLPPIPFSF
jgi:hypothetical protein